MASGLDDEEPRERVSFVLRLWLESERGKEPSWRWNITHVQSGEQAYAASIAALVAFVESRTECPGPR